MSTVAFSGLEGLVRLIYASKASLPPGPRLNEAVREILIKAIANNRMQDVTGLLLVHDGWFIQALEGPVRGVEAIYGKVLRDPRHEHVGLLALGPASGRAFRDWNMCERRLSPAEAAAWLRRAGLRKFDPPGMSAGEAFDLLASVGGAHAA